MWTIFITFWWFIGIASFYLSLYVFLIPHFQTLLTLKKLQMPNAPPKWYETLAPHPETPLDMNHRIANRYIELKYHLSTLQKWLLLDKGVLLQRSTLLAKFMGPTWGQHGAIVILSNGIYNLGQGPVSLTVFPSQLKFDGNFVSLSSRF